MWDKIIGLPVIFPCHCKICSSFPTIFSIVLSISSWSFFSLLFFSLLFPYFSSCSPFAPLVVSFHFPWNILNTFIHYLTFCFYHPPNIFKLQIREPAVFSNSSCLVTQSLLGDFKDSMFFPFLQYSFPVSSNGVTVIIKRPTSKETFHNNLTHVLRPLCSDSSRMTTRSLLSNQGTPDRQRSFPYRSIPIYVVIFRILIWHFTSKRYSEF